MIIKIQLIQYLNYNNLLIIKMPPKDKKSSKTAFKTGILPKDIIP